ncbi:MAG: lipocalin-like domain-containing protein [Xanthobacteraceae bacterium]
MLLNKRLAFSAMVLGIALAGTSQVLAQEKSFKDAIIGAWIVTSVFDEYQNGEKKDNWGGQVQGQLTFGRTGRFTQILVGPAVSSMKTDDPRKPDAMTVSYYGTYSVDESGKKINAKIEAASYSARANTDTNWTVQGSGDKLTLVGSQRKDQHGTFTPKLEVRRP